MSTELHSIVPSFGSVEALREGLEAKSRFEAFDLYPRDGSELLGSVEARAAELARVNEGELLVYNSGMSAVTEAIDTGLHLAKKETPIVACASETYSQTKRYLDHFVQGALAKVVYFDSGDPENVARTVAKQPDVIVAETVGNYVNVPVLDTDNLLNEIRAQDTQPLVVLDNTLPLSTAAPVYKDLQIDDKVVVVESGTKSYALNGALLGVGYTKNPELLDHLRRYRRTRGSVPDSANLQRINELLPQNVEDFDERNLKLFRSTGNIALALANDLGPTNGFVISHPSVSYHENHDYYEEKYPFGASPVLYIQSLSMNQYEVAQALWESDEVREQSALGQSFGFDHTRIVADENVGAVRIAGGAFTNGKTLGDACSQALLRAIDAKA